eukprot:SAG31_NODE_4395_length_3271_cov_3.996217_2_plen_87_part_00
MAAGAPFRPGNWGQSQMLDRCIYDLLCDRRLTEIAASVVGPEVVAHGDYVRHATPHQPSPAEWGSPAHERRDHACVRGMRQFCTAN